MAENQQFNQAMDQLIAEYQPALEMGLWIGTQSDCLYRYQSHQLFPAASIIKLAVYRYYLQQIQEARLFLDESCVIPPAQLVGGAGILSSLPERDHWQIRELLFLMIALSDNTATNVLIDRVGLSEIQASLTDPAIRLERYMMKPEKNKENQITAAASASMLMACLALESRLQITPSFFAKQQCQEGLPGLLAEADLPEFQMYNKTGRLHLIEHDVACFKNNQQSIYLAALSYDQEETGQGIIWLRRIGQLVYQHFFQDSRSI